MKYVIKELTRHKWRTIVSITGYAIAAFFMLLIISITGANKSDSFEILKGTGTHFIIYIPSNARCCATESGAGSVFAEGVNTQMLGATLLDSVKAIQGIKDAAPYLLFKIYNENYKTEISLGGIDTSSIATKNNVCAATNLVNGRFISGNMHEIVAEESFAKAHRLALGDTLEIFGGKMILAGIINSGIKPAKADFYAPIENVRKILKERLHCTSTGFDMNIILVEVADSRQQDKIIAQMKRQMRLFAFSSYNCYEPASSVMGIITKSSRIFTFLVFIFLVVFATKNQLSSLMERTREIGILKSLGWSDSRLSVQVILVSLIQSISGVVIGIILGFITIYIFNYLHLKIIDLLTFRLPYDLVPDLILLLICGGMLACILPIIQIYRKRAGDIINNFM